MGSMAFMHKNSREAESPSASSYHRGCCYSRTVSSAAIESWSSLCGDRHLLSDSHDPFNRMPLKEEDLIPNTELKARIQAWKAEMHEEARRKMQS